MHTTATGGHAAVGLSVRVWTAFERALYMCAVDVDEGKADGKP